MTDVTGDESAVVITRTLDAPVELIWRMWTEPEHFAGWYGPDEVSVSVDRMDVRVGGGRLVCMEMQSRNGTMRMWFTGEYREVVVNKRLIYTEAMADENGELVVPSDLGLPADHPAVTEVHVAFEEIAGRTRVVLTHIGIPEGSPGAAGWNMALDKLAARVAAQNN
jgi:uncharacterized protein YndB with AHSA1/START domain